MIARALVSLPLRARLTIWYSCVLLAVSAVFGAAVVWQQERIGVRRVDRGLDAMSATLDNMLREEIKEGDELADAAAETQLTLTSPANAIAIFDADGRPLAESAHLIDAKEAAATDAPRAWTASTPAGQWRVHLRPASVDGRTVFLMAASPLRDVLRERNEAIEAVWVGVPVVMLLAAAGGWWIASIGLAPITETARRAHALAPAGMEDLGQSDRTDELGQLARAFNGLVARLRLALRTQRQFMADASHELRTPVSVIQTTADVTLARSGRDEDDYRDAFATVNAEARRLGRLVDDMLVLARADAGGYPLRRDNVYLNELVDDCGRTVEVLARTRRVAVRTASGGDVPFWGDESLLRRMVLNLMQNAVAHTREGGVVHVEVTPNGGSVYVRVKDEGTGIPEADRRRIFDRFVQLDAARHGAGAGLGLPIARWIAEIHDGSLDLEDSGDSGSTFRIVLPLDAGGHA